MPPLSRLNVTQFNSNQFNETRHNRCQVRAKRAVAPLHGSYVSVCAGSVGRAPRLRNAAAIAAQRNQTKPNQTNSNQFNSTRHNRCQVRAKRAVAPLHGSYVSVCAGSVGRAPRLRDAAAIAARLNQPDSIQFDEKRQVPVETTGARQAVTTGARQAVTSIRKPVTSMTFGGLF
jgi:hypothetical protein